MLSITDGESSSPVVFSCHVLVLFVVVVIFLVFVCLLSISDGEDGILGFFVHVVFFIPVFVSLFSISDGESSGA